MTLEKKFPKFTKNFNLCSNNALNNIDPENFAQNQSMALLIGRPIAVVRASVNLELQGLPAINQDWHIFRQEMRQIKPLYDILCILKQIAQIMDTNIGGNE